MAVRRLLLRRASEGPSRPSEKPSFLVRETFHDSGWHSERAGPWLGARGGLPASAAESKLPSLWIAAPAPRVRAPRSRAPLETAARHLDAISAAFIRVSPGCANFARSRS